MKRLHIIPFLLIFQGVFSYAQNEVDALRYSLLEPVGTAKSVSMGGALGALGGDISVMATNPAGIGVYRRGDFVFSSVWNAQQVQSTYVGTKTTSNNLAYKPSNIGFVMAMEGNPDSPWRFVNIGFAYNQLIDFQSNYVVQGENPISSILHYETLLINNGASYPDENAYFLAGAVFFDSINNHYVNDYQNTNSFGNYQNHRFKSSGTVGEYGFTIAANYEEKIFIGATLGIQRIRYEQLIAHEENPLDEIPLVYLNSENYLKTTGQGYNLKLGIIYKINQMIRLGGAFHTPTVYNIRDDYWTDVYATIHEGSTYQFKGESPLAYYLWDFSSPMRLIGNAAFVFGKRGTLSAEYEFTDYSYMSMSSTDNSFSEANNRIDTLYRETHNFRVGGELLFGALCLRAGFQYLGSPFIAEVNNHENHRLVYSGGIGLTGKQLYFDFAYQYLSQTETYYLYNWEGSGAELKNNNSKYIATIGLRF